VEDKSLVEEILADLYAKWIVARFLGSSPPSGHTPGIGLKREGLEALTTFMSQVAGLSGKTLLDWLADTASLAQQGYCSVVADYAVAVVPVAWFLGSLAQAIITTGAGDRSSVISFVQSGFTYPRPSSPG